MNQFTIVLYIMIHLEPTPSINISKTFQKGQREHKTFIYIPIYPQIYLQIYPQIYSFPSHAPVYHYSAVLLLLVLNFINP